MTYVYLCIDKQSREVLAVFARLASAVNYAAHEPGVVCEIVQHLVLTRYEHQPTKGVSNGNHSATPQR